MGNGEWGMGNAESEFRVDRYIAKRMGEAKNSFRPGGLNVIVGAAFQPRVSEIAAGKPLPQRQQLRLSMLPHPRNMAVNGYQLTTESGQPI